MSSLLQGASILAERKGRKNDTAFIDIMKDLIIIKRARIIANSLSKSTGLDRFYLQSFNVPIKKVDISDPCNTELEDLDCCEFAFMTTKEIPEPIRYGVHPFNYVGALGGAKSYGWTTFGTELIMRHSPLTGKMPRHTYLNRYIYVFNKETESIRVEGVFADPRKVAGFMCCDDSTKSCYSDEQEFPIDEQNLEIIIDSITKDIREGNLNEKTELKVDHNE